MQNHHRRRGKIRGFAGNMGSGKTSRLIGVAYEPSKQASGVIFLQPPEANRADTKTRVESRIHARYEGAIPVTTPADIAREVRASKARNIFLEEIQFFGKDEAMINEFQKLMLELRDEGYNIYWSGLPLDFRGDPFEVVAFMMALSGVLEMLQVECAHCQAVPAPLPQRLEFNQPVPHGHPRFLADTSEHNNAGITYEPRCEGCHIVLDDWNAHSRAIHEALQAQKPSL